ncbi:hypothetical protein FXW78_54615 [Rhodococcus opacus]|nr:hypothetical protein [Rhodococcus opacus]
MCPVGELGEFLFGTGETDLEAFDLAEPALACGLCDAGSQVVADLGDSVSLGWVRPQQAAPQATVLMDFPGNLPCCR